MQYLDLFYGPEPSTEDIYLDHIIIYCYQDVIFCETLNQYKQKIFLENKLPT